MPYSDDALVLATAMREALDVLDAESGVSQASELMHSALHRVGLDAKSLRIADRVESEFEDAHAEHLVRYRRDQQRPAPVMSLHDMVSVFLVATQIRDQGREGEAAQNLLSLIARYPGVADVLTEVGIDAQMRAEEDREHRRREHQQGLAEHVAEFPSSPLAALVRTTEPTVQQEERGTPASSSAQDVDPPNASAVDFPSYIALVARDQRELQYFLLPQCPEVEQYLFSHSRRKARPALVEILLVHVPFDVYQEMIERGEGDPAVAIEAVLDMNLTERRYRRTATLASAEQLIHDKAAALANFGMPVLPEDTVRYAITRTVEFSRGAAPTSVRL